MNKAIFFTLSMMVVSCAYTAAPEAVKEVKKEVAETCKCDAKCTTACACPKCPNKNQEVVKAKEAVATQAVVNKQAETAKAKS